MRACGQFIYGFYPEPERWRVDPRRSRSARIGIYGLLGGPERISKNAADLFFFVVFPILAFWLLRGGARSDVVSRPTSGAASC